MLTWLWLQFLAGCHRQRFGPCSCVRRWAGLGPPFPPGPCETCVEFRRYRRWVAGRYAQSEARRQRAACVPLNEWARSWALRWSRATRPD